MFPARAAPLAETVLIANVVEPVTFPVMLIVSAFPLAKSTSI